MAYEDEHEIEMNSDLWVDFEAFFTIFCNGYDKYKYIITLKLNKKKYMAFYNKIY